MISITRNDLEKLHDANFSSRLRLLEMKQEIEAALNQLQIQDAIIDKYLTRICVEDSIKEMNLPLDK